MYSLNETKVMEWKGSFHSDDNAMYTNLKVEQTYGLQVFPTEVYTCNV